MKFEWDEEKNRANYLKHGVWFEEGQTLWVDEGAVEFFDPEHSQKEDRFIRIGHSLKSRILLVVFCERSQGEVVHIISASRATAKEQRQYEEGI